MGKVKRFVIGVIVQCGDMARFLPIDLSEVELEKLIDELEYLIDLAKFVALSILWGSIILEHQQFGIVRHDVGIAFTLQINDESAQTLSLYLISKGSMNAMKAQIEGMPNVTDDLWLRIAAILLRKNSEGEFK